MPAVVGRDTEIAALAAFFGASDPGLTAFVVAGEPGIGKTTVWEEGVRLARERGAFVLVARPAESERRLSYAALADLVSALPAELASGLPVPQRRALDVALLRTAAKRPPERRVVGTALRSLFQALATRGELVVALDDVQWLDPPSSAVLEFALRRLTDEPIRVLASVRSDARSSLILALPGERVARHLLRPLSVASLHQILAQRLGRVLPRPAVVRIAKASGGNPFWALELARPVDQDEAAPVEVPDDVRAVVRDRIRSLPPDSRAALLRAAAAARPHARLAGEEALAPAEEAGLVRVTADGRVAFAHPLYASAVYAAAPLARRREAHRELAETAEDAEERARHLALATDGPDDEVAGVVEQAARVAQARGAPDASAELTELALRLTPPASAAADERRLRLAERLELAGDLDRAREIVEELQSRLPHGDLRARAILLRADVEFGRSGESAAARLAEEALADAQDPLLRARCHADVAMFIGTVDVPQASRSARVALELLEQAALPDPGLHALALGAEIRANLFLGRGLDIAGARRLLELERDDPPPKVDQRAAYKLGQWLRYIDDLDGAREQLKTVEQAAEDEGDESSLPNILLNRLLVELWAGRWTLAAELAERLTVVGEQLYLQYASRVWQTYLDAHLGRLSIVRAVAESADRSEPIIDMLYLRSLGMVELGAESFAEADSYLRRATEIVRGVGIREPAVWRIEGEAVEAALAAGDIQRAEADAAAFAEQSRRSKIPWSLAVSARTQGLVLAAHGDLEGAAVALEESLAAHDRCPVPFERARTLLAIGRVRRRLKQKRLAREALDGAEALFVGLGSELWAERTREESRRVTTRRAPATLTATEHEIARLAADGLTNKAIAERAFVSVKTVEANLARVYRKLGITSRAQLARALDSSIS